MGKPKKRSEEAAAAIGEVVQSYKAFNADLTCNGFQYEIGKTYTHNGPVERCSSGFHACENPFDVLRYYPLVGSRFGVVEQGGQLSRDDDDSKIASAQITIKAELKLPDFIRAAVNWLVGRTKESATTGYRANAATTGDGANAATTGDGANAATTGYGANAATTGDGANAATTGDGANAATTGDRANAATTGDRANAATTGYGANAATTGKNSIAAALGMNSTASAGVGGAIMLAAYGDDGTLLAVFAGMVGQNGIEPGVTYRLGADGVPVRVDAAA